VRGIQDYIFGSPRLYEMRGASALLTFFDRAVVPRLVEDSGGEVIASGGGNFFVQFGRDDRAEAFREKVENAFFDLTSGHGIVVESLASDEAFPAAQRELHRRLRLRKHRPEGAQASPSMAFLKRCESCGRETADVPPLPDAERGDPRRQWLGPACDRKRQMASALLEAQHTPRRARQEVFGVPDSLEVPPLHPRLVNAELPRDFESLVGDDALATLVADGNNLGDWFTDRDRAIYQEISHRINKAFETSLDAALDAAFSGDPKPSVQVLICGGDDLVVAMPARRALSFAKALLESFRVEDPERAGQRTGLAAGLLVAKHSFPFRQAYALAEQLLHRAKGRCAAEKLPCALDLLRVTATQVQSLEEELKAREPEHGSGSRWSYGAAGPYTPAELAELMELSEELRRKVTPSQRGRLREILSPRDDAPESLLDEERRVPRRVVAELETWALRQDQEPFK
ncbi:MAG: Cas10/Cmr2 second palm domain-containing protein, partial [Thermoanaerobaculia bacterium]